MRKTIAGFLLALALAAGGFTQQQQPKEKKPEELKARPLRPVNVPAKLPPGEEIENVTIPRSYALVIGCGRFATLPKSMQLEFPESDARSIYSVLISPEGGNFPDENVHTLIGEKATLANIRYEVEQWLPSQAREGDRVLIFYAGHGLVANSGKPYLATYNTTLEDPEGTAYPMEDLGMYFSSRIKGKWKVLLTDTCHSGAIRPDLSRAINQALLGLGQSMFILTASRDRELSFESKKLRHGVYSYYLVKAMQGQADSNCDGVVTATELFDYLYKNVSEYTGQRQHPTSGQGSFDPNMLLAYNPGQICPDAPKPAPFGALVFESTKDDVEIFVDGASVGIVNKGEPLLVEGLKAGPHSFQAVKQGWRPDGPRDVFVQPGMKTTVTIRLMFVDVRPRAAVKLFDKGVKAYEKGHVKDYKKAIELLSEALQAYPGYYEAALYVGRSYVSLRDYQNGKKYMEQALKINPSYLEAHTSLAGMLLNTGAYQEAVQHLDQVVRHDPNNAVAYYLLAACYTRLQLFDRAIEAAKRSIALDPGNPEAYLWLAESLRYTKSWKQAVNEYEVYLGKSSFESGMLERLCDIGLGFLAPPCHNSSPEREDIWRSLRGLAYFGICDAQRLLSDLDTSIENCQKSLSYYPNDPLTHYVLGKAYLLKYGKTRQMALLPAAREHFGTALKLSPQLEQKDELEHYITTIDQALATRTMAKK